jgi:hypothetical protein
VRFYRHPLSTWGTTSDEMVTRDLMVHGWALARFDRPLPGWYDTHAARSSDWSAPTFAQGVASRQWASCRQSA